MLLFLGLIMVLDLRWGCRGVSTGPWRGCGDWCVSLKG